MGLNWGVTPSVAWQAEPTPRFMLGWLYEVFREVYKDLTLITGGVDDSQSTQSVQTDQVANTASILLRNGLSFG